jgi:mitosis inhibitor protein kinase SWE1
VGPIIFPTLTPFRTRRGSGSSSGSDCPSPIPPHRAQAGAGPRSRTQSQSAARLPFNRHASNSSASLFFGPSIPDTKEKAPSPACLRPDVDVSRARSKVASRHSYSGTIERFRPRNVASSCSPPLSYCGEDTDGDDLFGPSDTSFTFTVIEGTPSSRSRNNAGQMLPKKYKPRDSGVSFEEDSNKSGNDYLPGMPTASTSVSTIYSGDEALVTPIFGPATASGWPVSDNVVVVDADQDASMRVSTSESSLRTGTDAEGFIMHLLTGGTQSSHLDAHFLRKMPGTPVKKTKTANFAVNRPWQSAFTSKIGSEEFDYLAPRDHVEKGGNGKRPRKSLPAAFPMLTVGSGDCDSPTDRKDNKYTGLGLGRPSENPKGLKSVAGRAHWLMRRSSSGAFSSGSETSGSFPAVGTPTGYKNRGERLTRIDAIFF